MKNLSQHITESFQKVNEADIEFTSREELDKYYKDKLDKLPAKKSVPGGGSNFSGTTDDGKYNCKIDTRFMNIISERDKAIAKFKKNK